MDILPTEVMTRRWVPKGIGAYEMEPLEWTSTQGKREDNGLADKRLQTLNTSH